MNRDINDIFDDIALTEEKISKESYEEGFKTGVDEGNLEGYKLGYAQGVNVGEELGDIYGICEAHLLLTKAEKVKKTLKQLQESIDSFPRTNDPEADIVGDLEHIRSQFKKVKAMLRLGGESHEPKKDLSF
ncbi:ORAOV1 family protein [Megaselia abdita]